LGYALKDKRLEGISRKGREIGLTRSRDQGGRKRTIWRVGAPVIKIVEEKKKRKTDPI